MMSHRALPFRLASNCLFSPTDGKLKFLTSENLKHFNKIKLAIHSRLP